MASLPSFLRVSGLFRQDARLGALLPEAERLRQLNLRFAQRVPPVVARQCRIVALKDGTALVNCGSGAAAARLRSLSRGVAATLGGAGEPVSALTIKVRADWRLPSRPEKTGIGRTGLEAWRDFDHDLPDGPLKSAVDRLLAHHKGGVQSRA